MDEAKRDRLGLNRASLGELTQVPRIGVDKARKLVRYRAARKGLRDWADFAGTSGLTAEDVGAIRLRARIGPSLGGGPARAVRGRVPVRRPRGKRP